MISTKLYPIIVFVLALLGHSVWSQNLLSDTVYVDFNPDTLIELRNICIAGVSDSRDENPQFLRYVERKKYLLVPADEELYSRNPLREEIARGLRCDSRTSQTYNIDIRKFEIIQKKWRFNKTLELQAELSLYTDSSDTHLPCGTFYYDYRYVEKVKKESVEEETAHLLENWHRDFKIDLLSLHTTSDNTSMYSNFIKNSNVRSIYLNSRASVFLGYNWWGFQGELFFSRPETKRMSRYTSGIVRYKHNSQYESFAIGRSAEHYLWRKNNSWLFDIDLNLLLGFCRWDEEVDYDPKIQQLFEFSVSSVQSIQYNPKNQRSITFRAGIIENVSWIMEMTPKIQLGVQLGIGMKI